MDISSDEFEEIQTQSLTPKRSLKRKPSSSAEEHAAATLLSMINQQEKKCFKRTSPEKTFSKPDKNEAPAKLYNMVDTAIANNQPTMESEKFKWSYDKFNKAPHLVYVDMNEDKPINQMKISSYLIKMGYTQIESVSRIGYKKCKVAFKCHKEANNFSTESKLAEFHLKAFIPPNFTMKFGLIFGIPTEFSEKEIMEMAVQDPLHPITYVQRIKTRDKDTKELVDTTRIKVGFKADYVPQEIKLGFSIVQCKYYMPILRQCYNCQKFGHLANQCKTKSSVCVNCGQNHRKEDCSSIIKKCANCKGSHAATDKKCPSRGQFMNIQKLMVLKNYNYNEAKKATKPSNFNYEENDFPVLGNTNRQKMNQEKSDPTLVADKSFSEVARQNKQKKYHAVDTTSKLPIVPIGTLNEQETTRERPVYDEEIYQQHTTTAMEKLVHLLKKVTSNLDETNKITLLESLSSLIMSNNKQNEDITSKYGNVETPTHTLNKSW